MMWRRFFSSRSLGRATLPAFALALLAAVPSRATAATFNVAAGDAAGLAAAIQAANGNGEADTINLAAGTYTLTSGAYASFGLPTVTSEIAIVGAGAGSTTIERAAGSPDFTIFANGGDLRLEGLTVLRGKGSIQNSGTLHLVDSVVSGNQALVAISNGGDAEIDGSTITGGVFDAIATQGTLTVRNSEISDNQGKGINATYGSLIRIADSTIAGNGTGIYGATGYPTASLFVEIVRSTIRDNVGKGLWLDNYYDAPATRAYVTDSTVAGNGDGGIRFDASTEAELVLRRSTISGNTTADRGAGIYVNGASVAPGGLTSVTIDSSTISGNMAALSGGGIYLANGLRLGRRIRVLRSTITGNVADADANGSGDGGGISTPQGVVELQDTILAGNTDGGGESPDCVGPVQSAGHNLVGTTAGCAITHAAGDVSGAPLLGPLAANGGPTETHLPLAGSPAIDAADPARCGAPDQRDLTRPVDGDGDTVAACDIGAVEAGASSTVAFPWDPFLCYAAQTSHGTTPLPVVPGVTLTDDIESKNFDLKKSDALCTPADADGFDVADAGTHLHGRDIKQSAGQLRFVTQRGIALTTELGAFTVDATKPDRLLVPTSKGIGAALPPPDPALNDVDRYACYKIRASAGAPPLPRGASAPSMIVGNQFTSGTVFSLTKLAHLCTSVDESGQGRKNPAANLLCFQARTKLPLRDGSREPVFQGLYSSSEFGTERLDTKRKYEMCVPALREP